MDKNTKLTISDRNKWAMTDWEHYIYQTLGAINWDSPPTEDELKEILGLPDKSRVQVQDDGLQVNVKVTYVPTFSLSKLNLHISVD